MKKASTRLLEQETQTPSPAPDLIPAESSTENLHWDWYSKRGHFTLIGIDPAQNEQLVGTVPSATSLFPRASAFDWPLAVAAVTLKMSGSTGQSARVVMGYVAPVPWPSPEAEQALTGQSINERTAQEAAEAAVKNAKPLSHNAYKVQLARVAVKRAILKAASGGAA